MKEPLPQQITDRLKAVLRRVRRIQFFRGLLGVLTLGLAAILVIMAADFFFAPLSTTVRWALFVGLVVVVLGSFWKLFYQPLNRKIELLQVARWLEVRHPEMQERISTAMELAGSSGPGVSANLLEELIKEAEVDVKDIDPTLEVRTKKVRAWVGPAAGLVGILLILFAIWPDQISRLFVRAVAPFSETGNAGAVAFEILPGDLEVIETDPVHIKVLYEGSNNDRLILETTKEDGEVTAELLQFSGEEDGKQVATYQLATARESFRYRVTAGKNVSDAYKVTVWPKPRFSKLEAVFEYPNYTGIAREKRELGAEGIQAIVGTQMRLDGTPNTPIESGIFMIDGTEIAPVKIEESATGGRISIDFPMEPKLAGVGTIVLKHRLGKEVEAARFPVKALADEAPVVNILTPLKRELRVKPTDQIPITYQVLEEIGLQSCELLVTINDKVEAPLKQVLPSKVKGSKKHLWKGETLVYVGDLMDNYPEAKVIKLKYRVTDNRPQEFGGASIGESETITLKISRSAESMVRQELRAQESEIREAAEEAAKDIREAKQKMEANREQIKKEELPKHAEKQLEEAREKLADAEEMLKELAEKMENTVHAPKAEKAEKAAEKAKEAREKLENAPLQDTPEDKREKLDEARKAAEDALKEIEKMRREIEKDREKVEDIAKLNELAQKERELARKAEKKAEEQAQGKPEPENEREAKKEERQQKKEEEEWKQAQREVQEELRREVAERPEAKAEVGKQQAEEARELAEEARDLAEKQEQLKELAQDAQEAQEDNNDKADAADAAENAEAQERLKEEIKKQLEEEQKDVLEEAKEQLDQARENQENRADEIPEAVDEAQKALEELEKDQPKEAAEAAKEAAEKLNDLAKPEAQQGEKGAEDQANEGDQAEQGEDAGEAGDADEADQKEGDQADPELQDLAEKQEKVAEALEELAEGNTDKALEKLQELQADAAEKFEDAVEEIPEVDGKSNERNQAEQAARQADDHAGEAAKQAEEGNQEAAADRNEKAAEALGNAAKALDAEAANLEAKAAQARAQAQADAQTAKQAEQNQAPADSKDLAEAFQKAAEAAQADTPAEAAQASKEAAEALSELAQKAMQNMQGGQKPGDKPTEKGMAQQGQPNEPQPDDTKPGEGETPPEATPDPGVPPELAKLGVSKKDWEKLKEMMRSDVSGAGASGIPEDYRNLVKQYFEEVSREGKAKQ